MTRRPTRATLAAQVATLADENADLRARVAQLENDLADANERAEFMGELAKYAAGACNDMRAESDRLAVLAARALPDLGGPVCEPNPWAPAPIHDAIVAEERAA